MDIRKIVSEEINKFLINENINSLNGYVDNLNQLANQLSTLVGSLNDENILNEVDNAIISYVLQVAFAVGRCINKNSLNEGLGEYGLNIPPELGGNIVNHFKRGFYGTRNFFDYWLPNDKKGGNGGCCGGKNKQNQNTLQSEKLSVLLSKIQTKSGEWVALCRKYPNLDNYNIKNVVANIFRQLTALNNDYQQLVQLQNQQRNP